jgi:alpha-beta hydrolase superfamily lysophospholipase
MPSSKTPPAYAVQAAWREIQKFLPEELRLGPGDQPTEEWWEWRGHNVHLDRFPNPEAPVKLVLLHGVGTNGRQMSLIVGAPLAKRGFETVALDLPGYGITQVAAGHAVSYGDWVDLVVAFITAQRATDPRPIVLYGLSAGGMLTYHAAAASRDVAGIVGMTFLDQRDQRVRDETAYNTLMSRVGIPLANLTAKTPLARLQMPMRVASKMHALVNDPDALKVFLADKSSAGNWASMRFLASYGSYRPAIEPEDFDVCPLLLTQPAEDRWTPLHLSTPFLEKIRHVPTEVVMLENAGHYPLEQPGLRQMQDAIAQFASRAAAPA